MDQQTNVVDGKFSCPACGKRYAWKPQLAGKRAKCACGAAIVVPTSDATPATPPPTPARAEANPLDDPYEFAPTADEAAAKPKRKTTTPSAAAPGGGAGSGVPQTAGAGVGSLGYVPAQSRAEKYKRTGSVEDSLISKPRDVYLPYGLIVAGALAMIAWAMYELGVGIRGGVMAVSVVAGVTTLIKTGIILGLALLFAPKLGISFGDFRTAVRKLVAIVVVSDAALLWAGTIMEATGATRPGWISIREIIIRVVLAAAVISALCHYLFDMDAEETGMFAVPLALISLVLGFVLKIVAVVFIAAMVGAGADPDARETGSDSAIADGSTDSAAPPAAPTTSRTKGEEGSSSPAPGVPAGVVASAEARPEDGTPAGQTADASAAPAPAAGPRLQIVETDADRAIARRIREGGFQVRDAKAWVEKEQFRVQRERDLLDALFAAGARRVFFDFQGGRNRRPAKAYVELPDTADARLAILQWHADYRRQNNLEPDPQLVKDARQRMLVVELKQ